MYNKKKGSLKMDTGKGDKIPKSGHKRRDIFQ